MNANELLVKLREECSEHRYCRECMFYFNNDGNVGCRIGTFANEKSPFAIDPVLLEGSKPEVDFEEQKPAISIENVYVSIYKNGED